MLPLFKDVEADMRAIGIGFQLSKCYSTISKKRAAYRSVHIKSIAICMNK